MLLRKTRKRCKKFTSFREIIQRLSQQNNKSKKYYKNFESGLVKVSNKNKLTKKCYNIYAKSELLDYILYDVDNRKPTKATITIIDPKKIMNTKKEISDHYPVIGQFKFS